MARTPARPDYGIDAPGVVRALLAIGALLLASAVFIHVVHLGAVIVEWRTTALGSGSLCVLEGLLMLLYARRGKFRHRDRMLNLIDWQGDETVLDVGSGRGLLMIGAAKRLRTGRAIGIDIWSAKDLSGNTREGTLRNAELEGVRDRVDVEDGDATAMRFPDATFDVVLSNLCLHNIPSRAGRERACREIVRVLKPGGRALISDFMRTGEYAATFRAAGAIASRGRFNPLTFPFLRIVDVIKPASGPGKDAGV